ncbi:hypothetical protein BGZ46_004572 [Entomortierella lignicola]|nr:hypothetical protein BGZ46_004572 [Entomortierella lignicola]
MAEQMEVELQSPHGELRTAFYNPHEVKRRRRTSPGQFKILEKSFSQNPKPDASTRKELARKLSMSPRGIQVWFQNRRAKNRQVNNNTTSSSNNDDSNIPAQSSSENPHSASNSEQPGSPSIQSNLLNKQEVGLCSKKQTDDDMRGSLHAPALETDFGADPPSPNESLEEANRPHPLYTTSPLNTSDSNVFSRAGDNTFATNRWSPQQQAWKNDTDHSQLEDKPANISAQDPSGLNQASYADDSIDLSQNPSHQYLAKSDYSDDTSTLGMRLKRNEMKLKSIVNYTLIWF